MISIADASLYVRGGNLLWCSYTRRESGFIWDQAQPSAHHWKSTAHHSS